MEAELRQCLEGLAGSDRVACARRIASMGPDAVRTALEHPEFLETPGARRTLSRAIADHPDAGMIGAAVAAMGREDWRVFQVARDAIMAVGAAAVPALVLNLEAEERPGGRVQTIWCLLRAEAHVAVGAMIRAAEADPDGNVRAAALLALGRLGARVPTDTVLSALNDPSPAVWRAAAKAFGMLGRSWDTHAGAAKLTTSPDAATRAEAARSLGRLGGSEPSQFVIPLLEDADPYVRWAAAVALRGTWSPEAEGPLAAAAADPDEAVASAALETLALRLGALARPHLDRASRDPRPGVRETASYYLQPGGPND